MHIKPCPGDAIAINSPAATSTAFATKSELYNNKLEEASSSPKHFRVATSKGKNIANSYQLKRKGKGK